MKIDYAKRKGVLPARISQLITAGRLIITKDENGREVVVDCCQNDALFNRPAHNSKRKKNEI